VKLCPELKLLNEDIFDNLVMLFGPLMAKINRDEKDIVGRITEPIDFWHLLDLGLIGAVYGLELLENEALNKFREG